MNSTVYRKTVCPLDCPDACAIIAKVVNGRVVSLNGDPDHPYTNGFICRKMRMYHERVYSSQRLLHPMLRTGRKGAAEFLRISWEEAFALMAERFRGIIDQYGGEALLPYSYAGNMGMMSRYGGYPLFNKLGMSEMLGTICSAAAGAGWEQQCGSVPGVPPENCVNASLVVCWGINAKVSNVHFWQYAAQAARKGAKLLVIDPYRNETAKSADFYCPVRPGGDVPLALGIMKSLVDNQLFDQAFIEKRSTGFAEFRQMLDELKWPVLEADSGIGREEMGDIAKLLADNPKTFIRVGIGMTRNSRGGMAVRAVASLAAMLGLFSGGDGRGILLTSKGFRGKSELITRPEMAEETPRVINMIQLGQALTTLEPPVKGLIIYNTNPVSVNPDGGMVRRGLAREDLFTVVHEQVMTPTAKYADLLLPATTFLENRDFYTSYGQFYMQVTSPVISPLGEAKSNFDLWREFALHLGMDGSPFADSIDERLVGYLEKLDGVPGNVTPTDILAGDLVHSTYSCEDGDVLGRIGGKFAFATRKLSPYPASAALTLRGESGDGDLLARFPFHLITPPHPDLLNSTFGERYPGREGELLMHPEDAAALSLADGDLVQISNQRGRARRLLKVTEDTSPGVVVAEGIFWPVEDDDTITGVAGGINDVTSQKLTDMGGGATFHESLVSVQPV